MKLPVRSGSARCTSSKTLARFLLRWLRWPRWCLPRSHLPLLFLMPFASSAIRAIPLFMSHLSLALWTSAAICCLARFSGQHSAGVGSAREQLLGAASPSPLSLLSVPLISGWSTGRRPRRRRMRAARMDPRLRRLPRSPWAAIGAVGPLLTGPLSVSARCRCRREPWAAPGAAPRSLRIIVVSPCLMDATSD